MCDFKPGDEVVCVNNDPVGGMPWKGDVPVIGKTYTVRATSWFRNETHLHLCQMHNPHLGIQLGYRASRFRKVQSRDLSAWLSTSTNFEEPRRSPAKTKEKA
jgi:hypothetical protein